MTTLPPDHKPEHARIVRMVPGFPLSLRALRTLTDDVTVPLPPEES
jgi:hypothetical protein